MARAKFSSRGRGRPPVAGMAFEHLMLVARIESLRKAHSLLNACRIARRDHYPERSVDGVRQTYLELTKPKLAVRPGAVRNRYGYIDAADWMLRSKAAERRLDLVRRLNWILTAEEREKAGIAVSEEELALCALLRRGVN